MTKDWKIEDLEVVGYADPPAAGMVPAVVAPVFRSVENKTVFLIPPYSFRGDWLSGPAEVDGQELTALRAAGEIQLFENPRPARPGHELWIDLNFGVRYEPRAKAHDALRSIAIENIIQARVALREQRFEDADRLSGVALCADDRLVDPLAIKAAIRRLRDDDAGEDAMRRFASGIVTDFGFAALVREFAALGNKVVQQPEPEKGKPMGGCMRNMAREKAA